MKFAKLIAAPVVLASSLVAVNAAYADANSGLYSGISGNNTIVHDAGATDHHSTGLGAFVGYKYVPWFSTEITYDDYGSAKFAKGSADNGQNTKTYGLSLIPELPLGGGVSVFARGGFDYLDTKADVRDWAPVAGAGLKYQPSTEVPVFARVEYDRVFGNSNFKLDSTKLSLGVQF